jgi:hypothetical protein
VFKKFAYASAIEGRSNEEIFEPVFVIGKVIEVSRGISLGRLGYNSVYQYGHSIKGEENFDVRQMADTWWGSFSFIHVW